MFSRVTIKVSVWLSAHHSKISLCQRNSLGLQLLIFHSRRCFRLSSHFHSHIFLYHFLTFRRVITTPVFPIFLNHSSISALYHFSLVLIVVTELPPSLPPETSTSPM